MKYLIVSMLMWSHALEVASPRFHFNSAKVSLFSSSSIETLHSPAGGFRFFDWLHLCSGWSWVKLFCELDKVLHTQYWEKD